MSEENGNGNGYGKILLVIGSIIAIISAVVRPMNQSIDGIQKEIVDARKWQDDYMRGNIPSSAEKELSAMNVKFTEIETQFRNLNERTQRMEISFDDKLKSLDEKLQLEMKLEKQKP